MMAGSRHSILIQAIENGEFEIVNYLLPNGVSAMAKDEISGLTPLAAAAANGHEGIRSRKTSEETLVDKYSPARTPRALAFKNGHLALAHILSWRWVELPLDPIVSSIFEALNLDPHGIEPARISATRNRMAAAYYVQLGIKQPGERAFAGRWVMKEDSAFYSFGPGVFKRRRRELRSPECWQVPVFGRRLGSHSV